MLLHSALVQAAVCSTYCIWWKDLSSRLDPELNREDPAGIGQPALQARLMVCQPNWLAAKAVPQDTTYEPPTTVLQGMHQAFVFGWLNALGLANREGW
jgi:hypothetical protein